MSDCKVLYQGSGLAQLWERMENDEELSVLLDDRLVEPCWVVIGHQLFVSPGLFAELKSKIGQIPACQCGGFFDMVGAFVHADTCERKR